jgi:hypothetical protein
MFGTLVATSLADVGAETADLFCGLPAHAHDLCGRVTNGSTLHVQPDATGHHLHILFLQAGGSAMIAGGGTTQASLDTTLILLIGSCHN